jgi:hypothetical protein
MIDPSISLAVRPPVIAPLQIQTPLEKFAKIQTLRNLMGQGQLRELQMQEAQLGLQQTQKGIQQEESLGALFRRNLKPTPEEVYAISPKLGAAYVKSQAEQAKADLETRKTQGELLVNNAKRRATIAAGVTNLEDAKKAVWQAGIEQLYDLDPTKNAQIARDTLEHLQTQGFIPDEWKQHAMESLDFAARQELADKQAEEKRKQEKAPFDLRTATAGATKAEQEAEGTQPITRYQQAQLQPKTAGDFIRIITDPASTPEQKAAAQKGLDLFGGLAAIEAGARTNVLQTPEKIAQDIAIAGATAKAVAEAKPEKSTPAEKKTLAFWERGKFAADSIAPLEVGIANKNLGQQAWLQFMPNATQSEKDQKYRQAQRQFTESHLRPESGAAISETEYANDAKTYFAQPGDTPSTLAQKRAARAVILEGMKTEAGAAYEQKYGKQPPKHEKSSDPLGIR